MHFQYFDSIMALILRKGLKIILGHRHCRLTVDINIYNFAKPSTAI